jgi:hypothetical protein
MIDMIKTAFKDFFYPLKFWQVWVIVFIVAALGVMIDMKEARADEQTPKQFCLTMSTWVPQVVFQRLNRSPEEEVYNKLQNYNKILFNSREMDYILLMTHDIYQLPIEEIHPSHKKYVENVSWVVKQFIEQCVAREGES